jgi:hypothetical protein
MHPSQEQFLFAVNERACNYEESASCFLCLLTKVIRFHLTGQLLFIFREYKTLNEMER